MGKTHNSIHNINILLIFKIREDFPSRFQREKRICMGKRWRYPYNAIRVAGK
jgi:hypothetical protein